MLRRPALALLLCSLLAGCTGGTGQTGAHGATTVIRGQECRAGSSARCIRVGDQVAYAPRGSIDVSRTVVVLDLGGPGLDPLAEGVADSPVQSMSNVVVPLEPWVRATPSPSCRRSLDRYGESVRTGTDRQVRSKAATMAAACERPLRDEASSAAHGLAALLDGLRAAGAPDVVLVGVSFGAERVARAARPGDRVVLVSPYVTDDSLQAELERRSTQARRALALDPADRALLGRVRSRLPVRVAGRSVPLTRVDLDAAVIAAAYDPDRSRGPLVADLRRLDRATAAHAPVGRLTWLGKAADYLEGRYGRGQYYRGLVGYFGSYCAVHRSRSIRDRVGGGFLQRFHQICDALPFVPSGPAQSRSAGCAIVGARDPVASSWGAVRRRFPGVERLRVPGSGHATGADLALAVRVVDGMTQDPRAGCSATAAAGRPSG